MEHTISMALKAFKPRLDEYLYTFDRDNLDIVKRAGYTEIVKYVIPNLRKGFRTAHLPTALDSLETKYLERIMWPRSIFKSQSFYANMKNFQEVDNLPASPNEWLEQYTHTFARSTTFKFIRDSKRNKRALHKAAGLPTGGKKALALEGAIQYNDQVVKTDPTLGNCYSVLPGTRTQQSSPEDPKVRLVWSIPCHIWQMESELFDSAIDGTIERCRKADSEIQQFYWDPLIAMKGWVQKFSSNVTQWVSFDSTQYDSTVQKEEIANIWKYVGADYEFVDLLAEYAACSDILLSSGPMSRCGGMPSGSKGTNYGDGHSNVGDFIEVLNRCGLERYIVCILVNGDDITIGFSTKLSKKNLDDIAKYTRRDLNADKSVVINDAVWNSKFYCSSDLITRPIFRAVNSLMFKERQASALTANSIYVAIARHSILLDVEEHPLFEILASTLAKYEEMTLSMAMSDSRWKETIAMYISDHDYVGDIDETTFVKRLADSRYASEFAR